MYEIYGKLEGNDWELIDTAETQTDLDYMLEEYKIAFGRDWDWKIEENTEEEDTEE